MWMVESVETPTAVPLRIKFICLLIRCCVLAVSDSAADEVMYEVKGLWGQ